MKTEWEYACRAGSADWFHFGSAEADDSKYANIADRALRNAASHPYRKEITPMENATKYDDWIPRDDRFDDGHMVSTDVGSYAPNPWGLHDMHGNVAEWTRSPYAPYPYVDLKKIESSTEDSERVVRGGSWRDHPFRAHASHTVWDIGPINGSTIRDSASQSLLRANWRTENETGRVEHGQDSLYSRNRSIDGVSSARLHIAYS